jgi:tRNA pseudouridine38-40 synthase
VRIWAVVEYDGTDFAGFQAQSKGGVDARTVQLELERAIAAATGCAVRVAGSGRTDAGVHAVGQVVHFDCDAALAADASQFRRALNFHLPDDVAIHQLGPAPAGFHARYSATSRAYVYRIWNAPTPSPLWRRFAVHARAPLSVSRMHAAAQQFVGSHDFAAFGAKHGRGSTRRRVFSAEVAEATVEWANQPPIWQTVTKPQTVPGVPGAEDTVASLEDGDRLPRVVAIRIEANAFIRHMLRRIAGTLLRVGHGRLDPEDVAAILASGDKGRAGPTAPAHGLTLVHVRYDRLETADTTYGTCETCDTEEEA